MDKKILEILNASGEYGLTRQDIARKLWSSKNRRRIRGPQKRQLESALEGLIAKNKLFTRELRFISTEVGELVSGQLVRVSAGFGFARPEGWEKDVFVPGRLMRGAMPGDSVLLLVKDSERSDGLQEAEVTRIVEQAQRPFAGILQLEDGVYTLQTNKLLHLPLPVQRGKLLGTKPGDVVLAELAHRGERHSEHTAQITENLGSSRDPAACCVAILQGQGIPTAFPAEAAQQATIAASQEIHPKELASRTDLREEIIFTIDGADSKDLDDAISLRRDDAGWELGVHIADVSHYIGAGTPLDEEALRRGSSLYYADQVVPMLPHELSNGICSLHPGEDRLAFSAFIRLDGQGNRTGYRFVKTVIRSRVKGVYAELNELHGQSSNPALEAKYTEVRPAFTEMAVLAQMLIKKRQAAGKMMLQSVESHIVVGQGGEVERISPREHGFCQELIEEFMLQANEAAAHFALEKGLPFVFRVHDNPSPAKLEQLAQMLEQLGIPSPNLPQSGPGLSDGLTKILHEAEGRPCAGVVNTLTLRSMAKARYSSQNTGHFGLALENYAHFTSPIRRYPDLTIHRTLSAALSGAKPENLERRYRAYAVRAAAQGTARELAIAAAARDCESCYKASFMRRFLGEEMDGIVSGCISRGIYVQLANTCEGMVHRADFPLGDWEFDGFMAFVEGVSGKAIRLGDSVKIRVLAADVFTGRVDFALA